MQRRSPWSIVWPSLVGHLLIAAVLLKALPPAAVGTTGTHDAVDVVMVEVKAHGARVGAPRDMAGAAPEGRSLALRRSLTEASLVDHHRHRTPRSGSPPGAAPAMSRGAMHGTPENNSFTASRNNHVHFNATRARILARIYRAKRYPAEARRKQLSGRPVVTFRIRRDGTTTAARIITSSGSAILDTAALETIRRAEPFPYFPDPFPVLINYRLLP